MSRKLTMTVLASAVLVLTASIQAGAQGQAPPPYGLAPGVYDSFSRNKNPDNTLPPNNRTGEIRKLQAGAIRLTSTNAGQPSISQLFISPCGFFYDGRLVSYVQNFVPPRGYKGTIKEIKFVYRINDPIGDYDVYYTDVSGGTTSEVLKRR